MISRRDSANFNVRKGNAGKELRDEAEGAGEGSPGGGNGPSILYGGAVIREAVPGQRGVYIRTPVYLCFEDEEGVFVLSDTDAIREMEQSEFDPDIVRRIKSSLHCRRLDPSEKMPDTGIVVVKDGSENRKRVIGHDGTPVEGGAS